MAVEVGKALAVADVDIGEVYEQIMTRIEIENAVSGTVGSTARRVVNAFWDITRARRRKGLPVYPQATVHSVMWLLVRNH